MVNNKIMQNEIELLAPAGSMEQAMKCIEAGCNAIYGGLKSWNARMNAKNFTVEEYKELIAYCHQRGVKFYMTLNTLFKDSELEEVVRLLSDRDFVLPDAVIAADMGLISVIAKKFPNMDIHASTQFGTVSVDDIAFLKKYNVNRVILSRELTLDAIKNIRSQSDIQLEVFVYGSQCICFSGQCLWGGLTQERSGNRGRCPAACRDFYESGDKAGQLLYPQDINASGIIKQLKQCGIDSIKIEGRFRNSTQIASIVKEFRKAIDDITSEVNVTQSNRNNLYVGYLGNKIPVHGILNALNPRTVLTMVDGMEYGKYDFTAVKDSKHNVNVISGSVSAPEGSNKCYIKTNFSNTLLNTNNGAVITLVFDGNTLKRIDVENNIGLANTYVFATEKSQFATVSDIVSVITKNIKFELLDIVSSRSEHTVIECNLDDVLNAVAQMNQNIVNIPRHVVDKIEAPGLNDYLQVCEAEMLRELKERGYHNFIFNIQSVSSLEKALLCENEQDHIIYRLPMLDFNNKLDDILRCLYNRSVMVGRWSQLLLNKHFKFKEVYADYTLNVWNREAVALLKSYGVKKYIVHPETTLNQNTEMIRDGEVGTMAIYMSRIPIGYTRACFRETGVCDGKCGNTDFWLKNKTKQYSVHVFCNNELGYRVLATSFLNAAYGDLRGIQRIYDFSLLDDDEIHATLHGGINNATSITSIYGRKVL